MPHGGKRRRTAGAGWHIMAANRRGIRAAKSGDEAEKAVVEW